MCMNETCDMAKMSIHICTKFHHNILSSCEVIMSGQAQRQPLTLTFTVQTWMFRMTLCLITIHMCTKFHYNPSCGCEVNIFRTSPNATFDLDLCECECFTWHFVSSQYIYAYQVSIQSLKWLRSNLANGQGETSIIPRKQCIKKKRK